MKRFKTYFPLLPICLLLLLLIWHSQTPPAPEADQVAEAGRAARPARASAERASPGSLTPASMARREFLQREASDLELPKPEELRWKEPMPEPIFEEFRRWTAAAPAARTGADLQHGVELARQRRAELLDLIERNPQRALELAVPDSLRRQLPDAIVALLEERVDAQGDLMVQSTTLDNDRGCMIERTATLQNGEVFEVHTYGRRSAMPTRDNIAIHGVALDGKLALSEFPGRVLEPSEVAVRVGDGQILIESADSADSEQPTDAADGTVIAFGDGRMIRYRDETQAVAALLLEEDAERSGATAASADDLDGVIAYSPRTEGRKTMLIIRVDFPDYQGGNASDSELQTLISEMNSVYTDMSYGKASFALNGQGSVITPTLRLPNNVSHYTTNSFSRILTDARTAAANAGYNYTNYTYEVVVTGAQPVVPGSAGVAFVGGRGTWLHNSQWNLKTCAHELGHNFGLPHAGAWDTDDGSVIGPGEVWDYGNVFDMMGVGPSPHASRHFGSSFKEYLDWLPTSDVVKITANGHTTTRIRAMDKIQADGNKRALVVDRPGTTKDYWIEHRQLYGTNHGMRDGVLVNWANIGGGFQQPLLLDMRPDTSEKTDAVLPIGKTFSDTAAAVHITPVGRGTDPDGVNWIDVAVTRGAVAGNLPPVASIGATNSNPAVNASVTFTCTASDPNGDKLAYFWDWGNGTTTSNNSPTASKSWPAGGIYIVRCTVSDMKGLSTTAEYVVQVGATTTFFITGEVRRIQGEPLQGVVVTASPTALKATSDATGRFIITGLAAGTYTLTASSVVPDGFTNPVTVGPSLQGRNFVRQPYALTWDANAATAGAQDGGGTWAENGGNWRIAATGAANQKWKNTNLDSAVFGAGVDGNYAVNLSGVVQVGGGITFANSGYRLGGGAPHLHDGTNNSPISVAEGKSATINSTITYLHNKRADITVDPGAVLNLGGGASNSQYAFNGDGTVNLTAGTYTANFGSVASATFNQTGGIFDITPANNGGYSISSNSRSLTFSISGGTLTVNGNASTATVNNSFLAIGNGTGASNTSTMIVKSGATVNVGTTASRSGEIRIANTPQSNGALDVQGGTLTVGTGSAANKIYFFKAGTIDAPYFAGMSQSGGTVTANGIQFGGDSGTYHSASSAALRLSGGTLHVGAQGINRGSAAAGLAVEIQLQGGTLGASQNWGSPLDMRLGSVLGGVTIRAEDAVGTARIITLTGNLSDDGEVSGTLTKTGSGLLALGGANTFTGGLVIRNGTVDARTNNAALGAGTVVMGGIGSDGATLISGRALGNAITVNAPESGSIVIGANTSGSGYVLSGAIALNGNLTIQTFNNPADPVIKATGVISGGITGTGHVLLNNNGLSANVFNITGAAINHTGSLTLQGTATGNTNIGAVIGSNVTGITQNSATSTMVLSGANSYACNLTVNAGTVRISDNTNTANDTSTVTIAATGATLDLTYAGTDAVDKLFIGATEMPAGIYGKLGSVLPVIGVAQITGDGTLTVGIPVTPPGFSSWIEGEFANGSVPIDQRGLDDDPDNDGIPNLMEYAIADLDPTVRNPTYGSFTGNTLSFAKREDATGLSYAIQESTSLGRKDDWTEVAGDSYVNDSTTISYTLTPPTPPKNFLRLRVVQN
jgi:autotransporter-associated beta strand protein